MKFSTITIKNFFSYQGEIIYRFDDSNKPITLIIGENGFGKTSFINSIKIALHGVTKDLLSIGELVLTKSDFILGSHDKNFSGLLNRIAKINGENKASVTIEVLDDEPFIIHREFVISNTSYHEHLSIKDRDDTILYEDIEAQDFINYKISPTLAKFFFFDGEKIQTIADFSKDEFRQMLEDVLELDIYDQLINDSYNVIKKINKNELDPELQKRVLKHEEELNQVQEQLTSLTLKLEEESLVLNELLQDQSELDQKLSKLKSKYKKPLEDAKRKFNEVINKRSDLLREFKEVTYAQLPLLLSQKLKEKITKDISENYRGNLSIPKNIIDLKKKEFLSMIDESQQAQIEKIYDQIFNTSNSKLSVLFADSTKIELQYETFKNINFVKLLDDLVSIKEEINTLQTEIHDYEHNIQMDQKEYEQDFKRVKSIAEKVGSQRSKIEDLKAELEWLKQVEKNIKLEIGRTSIQDHQNSLAKLKVEALESAIKVAAEMKLKIKEDKRELLEESINAKFNLLKKEGYEANYIKLNSDFNINIYDINHRPMDILSSSSGQKQIIATSLIWGISEYISEEIPMIIDTPLGRLDEENQSLILTQFYPNASSQVLILPTPSELRHEGFKSLIEEVSQVFLLSNGGSATSISKQNTHDFFSTRYN
ncbi:AAA family ATPase [Sulfurospirillum cavolei]|uniref:AAA family ATPase n=1 Tax=Sulfurospirillum cavolei TaxID=366522 RepID=UPI0005A8B937|nr:AAA family ATPase [Sulfurospirillum cavolei]